MTRFAAAQTIAVPGDVEVNVERHAALIEQAVEQRVEVLVFPEMSLTGYQLEGARDLAFVEEDPRLSRLRNLAASARITLVVGAPVRVGSALHIGAFLLTPDRGAALYTKRFLGEGEGRFFTPGDRDPLLAFGTHTAAIAVCADANHQEHPDRATSRGADVYLLSSHIVASELPRKSEMFRGYARRNAMMVVFANYGGADSGGHSTIWSCCRGEVSATLANTEPGLIYADW